MILTVEIKSESLPSAKADCSEVAISFDEEGLALLMNKLSYLSTHIDHTHLMTPSWGGRDLTEIGQGGQDYQLVHHLRIVRLK